MCSQEVGGSLSIHLLITNYGFIPEGKAWQCWFTSLLFSLVLQKCHFRQLCGEGVTLFLTSAHSERESSTLDTPGWDSMGPVIPSQFTCREGKGFVFVGTNQKASGCYPTTNAHSVWGGTVGKVGPGSAILLQAVLAGWRRAENTGSSIGLLEGTHFISNIMWTACLKVLKIMEILVKSNYEEFGESKIQEK